MPHGFFTIEKWDRPKRGKSRWIVVCNLDARHSLSEAMRHLESLRQPGFYRVVQTQRMVWAETENGKLRLRKWHASSPESLARSAAAFDRDGGKYPESADKETTSSGIERGARRSRRASKRR